MTKLLFSELSKTKLKLVANLQEVGTHLELWDNQIFECTSPEREKLRLIQSYLRDYPLSLMNEATIWSRAIYPLLMLAETGNIQAWAQVPLKAQFPNFEMEGIADGVLVSCIAGEITAPYLVVVEAKRGLEAPNPKYQLYGEMLVAAWLNWQENNKPDQEIFGCYTITDNWTFVHGRVTDFDQEKPLLEVKMSREYIQRSEPETILQILKAMITQLAPYTRP